MYDTVKSIRTFIGAHNFEESRLFYQSLDFKERVISDKMSLFIVNDHLSFYLQDYYVKDWIDNSMVLLEMEDLDAYYDYLKSKNLRSRFSTVKFTKIKNFDYGREIFLHDPSGVLWHFCEFKK